MNKIAIFFQSSPPPIIDGIKKPFKEGGYSDSGADIGFSLKSAGVEVITPKRFPNPLAQSDWVFPDTAEGFQLAYNLGARTFWLNTVLYKEHPITTLNFKDVKIIGQNPADVEKYDDKFSTNQYLSQQGLSVAKSVLIKNKNDLSSNGMQFPFVLKPVRGRGSQGVVVIRSEDQLDVVLKKYEEENLYGDAFIAEELLPGEEITIAVLPSGTYDIAGRKVLKESSWSLNPVRRFNHHDDVAPYNGVVPVKENSQVLASLQLQSPAIQTIMNDCAKAGSLLNAKTVIRIDCRQDATGAYKIFDLNMKPNMTGPGRPGRDSQESLVLLAAQALGWTYAELLKNLATQAWSLNDVTKST